MKWFQGLAPVVLGTLSFLAGNVEGRSQAPDPISYASEVENAVFHTPSHRVHSYSDFDVTFSLHKQTQRIKLTLEPNHDILADDAVVQYLNADGSVRHSEPIERTAHRVFKGSAWVEKATNHWSKVGWARIYVKQDGPRPFFEGAFSVMHDYHHVQLRSSYMQTRRESDVSLEDKGEDYMIVFRDSDLVAADRSELKRSVPEPSCQADKLSFNADPNHPVFRPSHSPSLAAVSLNQLFGLSRRQSDTGGVGGNTGGINLASTIGNTAGCPTTKRVALIGVATDCSFTAAFNASASAREDVIQTVNSASSVYENSFNISIGLRNLIVSDANCSSTAPQSAPWNIPCASGNISQRLNLFTSWRGGQNDTNAYWTLMSNCPTGAEVGVSWLGQLCNTGGVNASVAGANVVVRTSTEWQVFAHESGHTFGAVHDCDSSTCAQGLQTTSQCCPFSTSTCDANGQFIMNPSAGPNLKTFSQCTVGNICSALGRNSVKSNCLVDNKGVVTITGGQCGNGIVESGEECDCGGTQGCGNNSCCDATTCKFKNNAVCDGANEACCSNCQFARNGTVCRASTGPCDLQEVCPGTSGACPSDQFIPDGRSCGNSSGLTCASGQCTSRDLQCREVLGAVLGSNDTYACDSSTCTILCASSKLPSNQCGSLNQNFLDGTPCNGNGHCSNGACQGDSVGGEIKSWVDQHKSLVIGLAAGLGGLLLLVILSCIVSSCRRRRYKNGLPAARGVPYRPGWAGPMPSGPPRGPPPMQQPQWGAPPPYPPPVYSNRNPQGGIPMSNLRYA